MFRKYGFKILTILVILLFPAVFAHTHSGRTDKYGEHYDHKNGGCHYHNSGSVQPQSITLNATSGSQKPNTAQAIMDAKTDIQEPYGWLIGSFLTASVCGCLGGSVILLSSQIITPTPPIHRLIGKSPEYVAYYTDAYQQEVKSKRLLYSASGCLGGTIVAVFLWSDLYTEGY